MREARLDIRVDLSADFRRYRGMLRRLGRISFVSDVLDAMNYTQGLQRRTAPIGTKGPGPHGRIPRSIRPARITRSRDTVQATTVTHYGPAVFTNSGTGKYGPEHRPYTIRQLRTRRDGSTYIHEFVHPGIRGTHWWNDAVDAGAELFTSLVEHRVRRAIRP